MYAINQKQREDKTMQKIIMLTAGLTLLLISACTQKVTEKEIPITTSSSEARELFLQGRENIENGESLTAANLFDQAINKDSGFVMAYCFRAMSGGGTQLMYSNINKAKTLATLVSPGEKLFVDYIMAAIDNDRTKGKYYLDSLLAMYPGDKHLKLFAGNYHQSINDYGTAINYFTKAAEIDSEYAPAYNLLGYANVAAGNFESAEKNFLNYIKLMPDKPNPYDSYAEFLMKRGRYDESITQYNKAYGIDSNFVSALIGLGDNYLFKGDFAKAREYYKIYFDKSAQVEDKLNALYLNAVSYLYEDNLNEALNGFAEWRSLAEKENEPVTVLFSYLWQGFALTEMGQPAGGLKKIKEASDVMDKLNFTEAEKETRRVDMNGWMVYGYYSNNMMDEAKNSLALYNQDVERRNNPNEKIYVDQHLAVIDLLEGKYDKAVNRLSILEPNPHRMYYHAQALLKMGNKTEAVRLLKKIINWNKNSIYLAAVWTRAQRDIENNADVSL